MKTQMSALHRSQTFLRILIFTLVTAIIWVGLSLFRTQEETGISPKLLKLAEPLNPNINIDVLSRIEQKRGFTEQELSDFPIYSISTDKSGGEQVVVFTAGDKVKKAVQTESASSSAAAVQPSPQESLALPTVVTP